MTTSIFTHVDHTKGDKGRTDVPLVIPRMPPRIGETPSVVSSRSPTGKEEFQMFLEEELDVRRRGEGYRAEAGSLNVS